MHYNKPLDQETIQQFLRAWSNEQETRDLDQAAASPTTLSDQGNKIPQEAQVNPRYGRFLYNLVKIFRPNRILEIGMANGVSSAYIAKAQLGYIEREAAHTIIDPFQSSDWHGAGKALLRRLNLDKNTRLIEDFSMHVIPQLQREGETFGFVFIDGNHCMDYVLSDVLMSDLVLETGGLLALDDSNGFGVKLAIPYMDTFRHNLSRVKLDPPISHWLREHIFKRRRITIYQKNSPDQRGADAT